MIDIGTIAATVLLDLQPLAADSERALQMIAALGAALRSELEAPAEAAGASLADLSADLSRMGTTPYAGRAIRPGGGEAETDFFPPGTEEYALLRNVRPKPRAPSEEDAAGEDGLPRGIERAEAEAKRRAGETGRGVARELTAPLEQALQSLTDHLAGAFQALFEKGPKRFFQEMLDNFRRVLEQMAAEWLAKSAVLGLTALSGIGGGAPAGLGALAFGFDDASNDRQAQHWGWDFADHFTRGIQDWNNQRQPSAARATGNRNGDPFVTVTLENVHVHHESDYRRIGEAVARHTQEQLRVLVGS